MAKTTENTATTIYKNLDTVCPNCSVAKTFEDGKVHSNEEEVITRDGKKVSLIVYSAPITDEKGNIVAVMEMSTNISEVKRLQSELETQRQKVEQIFNVVPCYISVHDRDFNILQTNEMFKRDFGDREGQKCHRVYKGSDKICHDCPVQKTFQDGEVHSSEEVVITKDGQQANVIVYTAPIRDEAGNIRAVMEMSTNITEVKRLQSELETPEAESRTTLQHGPLLHLDSRQELQHSPDQRDVQAGLRRPGRPEMLSGLQGSRTGMQGLSGGEDLPGWGGALQ